MTGMNGLRIYINPEGAGTLREPRVFYSRRADGPYYCWRYEEQQGQWRGARVHQSDVAPKSLSMVSWKAVPSELQTRLGEYYLE
jgi:hypothetical protein